MGCAYRVTSASFFGKRELGLYFFGRAALSWVIFLVVQVMLPNLSALLILVTAGKLQLLPA